MGKKNRDKKLEQVKKANLPEASLLENNSLNKKKKKENKNLKKALSDIHDDQNQVKIEKKTKKQKAGDESVSETKEEVLKIDALSTECVTVNNKNKKKKKRKGNENVGNVHDSSSCSQESNCEDSKKMKMDEGINGDQQMPERNVAEVSGETESNSNPNEEQKKKKKKKKKQGIVQLQNSTADSVQSNNDSVTEVINKEENENNPDSKKKKKRKLNKQLNKSENENEPLVKKKKGSQSGKETENSDNDTTGKENEMTEEDVDIGQWSTEAFEDSERQEKFIKLLGGKKKEDKTKISGIQKKLFSIGMADVGDFKSGTNRSMDWKQQNNHFKAMETEFDGAKHMHFKRGSGFGFRKPPSEGNKFFIDTAKNKSKKFDD